MYSKFDLLKAPRTVTHRSNVKHHPDTNQLTYVGRHMLATSSREVRHIECWVSRLVFSVLQKVTRLDRELCNVQQRIDNAMDQARVDQLVLENILASAVWAIH